MAKSASITRRAALIGALTSSAALVVPATAALAAVAAPEDHHLKIRRLADEISVSLDQLPDGSFDKVEITKEYVAHSYTEDDQREIKKVEKLIVAHEKAWLAFDASCPAADRNDEQFAGQAGIDRNNALDAAEQRALLALLKYPPRGPWARNRKATYLLTTIGDEGRWTPNRENTSALLSSLL